MSFPLCKRIAKRAGALPARWLLLFLSLPAAPAMAALVHGDFNDGLYTAPDRLFTVRSPLGPNPTLVDWFDRRAGAVTFVDDAGQLFGVVCTPNFDVLAGADIDLEAALAILRNWFREATFPAIFENQLPGSTILREEPGEFEGQPAWIAVLYLPGASASARLDPATGQVVRSDSWRGVVIFSRDGHTYLLMTEASETMPAAFFDASATGWNGFLPRLAQFYRGMTFKSLADEPDMNGRENGTAATELAKP
jgi:hypothetical protein